MNYNNKSIFSCCIPNKNNQEHDSLLYYQLQEDNTNNNQGDKEAQIYRENTILPKSTSIERFYTPQLEDSMLDEQKYIIQKIVEKIMKGDIKENYEKLLNLIYYKKVSLEYSNMFQNINNSKELTRASQLHQKDLHDFQLLYSDYIISHYLDADCIKEHIKEQLIEYIYPDENFTSADSIAKLQIIMQSFC